MRTPPHSQGTEQIYMELMNITYAHFAAHTIVLSAYVNVNNSLVKVTLIDIALLLLLLIIMHFLRKGKLLTVQITSKRSLCSSSNYILNNESYPSMDGWLAPIAASPPPPHPSCDPALSFEQGLLGSQEVGGVAAGQGVSIHMLMQNFPTIITHLIMKCHCHDQARPPIT